MSWKQWDQGEVVEAGDFQDYLQDQVVQYYPTVANRTTALDDNVTEGMVSYIRDEAALHVYNDGEWRGLAAQSPNYIINGAFDVWQRGTSFVGLTADAYTADRWEYSDSGATATISRQTFTPAEIEALGFGDAKYYLRYQVTVGDANNSMLQKIEDVRTLAGQTVTLSFWAKANAEITIDPYLVKYYGSGGSSTEAVGNGSTVTIGTTWQRLTKTITIGSNSGKTINDGSYLMVNLLPSGSGTFTIDYWGVQLEAGSVATPFKRHAPSLQGELAACQRYYQKSYPIGLTPGTANNNTSTRIRAHANTGAFLVDLKSKFFVPMRTSPTVKWYSTSGLINNISYNGANVVVSNAYDGDEMGLPYPLAASSASAGTDIQAHWTAEAEL